MVRIMFFSLVIVCYFCCLAKIVQQGIGINSFEFIFDDPKNNMTEGGIFPAIFGTIAVTFIMILICCSAWSFFCNLS